MNIKVDFSDTLNHRYENAKKDMRQMNRIKAEIDFNKMLQKALTDKPNDEDEIQREEKNF